MDIAPIACWQVTAWEPAFVTEPEFLSMVPMMRHVSSHVAVEKPAGRRRGSTLWAVQRGSKRTGIAWDWVEMRRGVIALEDPMNLLSNLRIMEGGEDGCELPLRLQRLNYAVNQLDWQDALQQTLSGPIPAGAPQALQQPEAPTSLPVWPASVSRRSRGVAGRAAA